MSRYVVIHRDDDGNLPDGASEFTMIDGGDYWVRDTLGQRYQDSGPFLSEAGAHRFIDDLHAWERGELPQPPASNSDKYL